MGITDTIKKGYEKYKADRAEEKEVERKAKEEAKQIEAQLRAKQRKEELQERYEKIKNRPYEARARKARLKRTIVRGAKTLYKKAMSSQGKSQQGPAFGSNMGDLFGPGFGGGFEGGRNQGFGYGSLDSGFGNFVPKGSTLPRKRNKKSSRKAHDPWSYFM